MPMYDVDGNQLADASISEPAYNDIPTVAITGTLPLTKDEGELPVLAQYKSKGLTFTSYATLKVQGSSSQYYPKKNYTIKMFKDNARTQKDKREFYDWGKANKYVLKANWIDHSHARNIVNARLWTQICKSRANFNTLPEQFKESHMAVDGFPVKVFANGIYLGLYTWNLPKSALYGLDDDIDENALIQGDPSSVIHQMPYSGSVLFRAENDNEEKWSDETHDEKPQEIIDGWNRVLSFVYTSSDANFVANIEDYLDKESVIDQYIFIYVGCIVDNLAKNQTFFTYDALKWYGGMYDMDGTWGLPPFPSDHPDWHLYNTPFQSGYTLYTDYNQLPNLLYDKVERLFDNEIKQRYAELRSGILSDSNIDAEFDKFMSAIPPYLYEEDYASATGNGAFTNIPFATTNNQLQIRPFVKNRLAYVDGMILNTN